MFIHDFGIEDQLLIIIGVAFGVAERHISAHIQKEQHVQEQISTGGMDQCHTLQSGTEQDRDSKNSDRYQGAAQIRIERYGQHGSESDLNVAEQEEKSGTDIGESVTGVTDQDGVVWDERNSVQRWVEVDIG